MLNFSQLYLGIFSLFISFLSFLNIIYCYYFDLYLDIGSFFFIFLITLFFGSLIFFKKKKFKKNVYIWKNIDSYIWLFNNTCFISSTLLFDSEQFEFVWCIFWVGFRFYINWLHSIWKHKTFRSKFNFMEILNTMDWRSVFFDFINFINRYFWY